MLFELLEEILNSMSESRHAKRVPIKYQLSILGLGNKELRDLEGARVLDLACGSGRLVTYLRDRWNVDAYGIDSRAPEADYFFQRNVTGVGNKRGIPFDDGSLDMIFSFQNPILNIGLKPPYKPQSPITYENENKIQAVSQTALCMLSEIERTLKPGAKAVIFPNLKDIERIIRQQFLGGLKLKISRTAIRESPLEAYIDWEKFPVLDESEGAYHYRKRLNLTRTD